MAFTPTGGSTAICKIGTTTIPGHDWKISIDPHLKDCSNFTTGRLKVATLTEATVSVKLIWDTTAQPTDTSGLNLRDGAAVTIKCFVDATRFFSVAGLVSKVEPHLGGIEDVLMFDVEIQLSNSTVTYPV